MNNKYTQRKGWQLVNKKGCKYFQSELLSNYGFNNFFFSRSNTFKNPNQINNDIIKSSSTVHRINQIHGNKVINASSNNKDKYINADGIVSDNTNQSLWIYTADCIPILFADTEKGHVAAAHAGWKGLAKKIINNTVNRLISNGSKTENIIVALGPAISLKNYQVGIKVIQSISRSFINSGPMFTSIDNDNIKSMFKLNIIKEDEDIDKFLLDIRLVAYYQLIQKEIKIQNISISNICTFEEDNLFNSWRREKIKTSQWSTITSRSN